MAFIDAHDPRLAQDRMLVELTLGELIEVSDALEHERRRQKILSLIGLPECPYCAERREQLWQRMHALGKERAAALGIQEPGGDLIVGAHPVLS